MRPPRTSHALDAPARLLAFHAPYDWPGMLAFLAARSVQGVESVEGQCYRRTLRVDAPARGAAGASGWIEIGLSDSCSALTVRTSASLAAESAQVSRLVEGAFDVHAQPRAIGAVLGALGADRPGLRLPGAFDAFELVVRAVLGQQVTVRAARTLAGRFAARFGELLDAPADPHGAASAHGLERLFPTPARIASASVDEVATLGIIAARARTILALARALADRSLVLARGAPMATTLARLREIPGIGDWTAQYVAMRVLGCADAFPASDLGVMKALGAPTAAEARARAERYRPWRAYAVVHLWASLAARGKCRVKRT